MINKIALILTAFFLNYVNLKASALVLQSSPDSATVDNGKSIGISQKLHVQTYDANSVGYSFNSNDQPFLDCRISVVYMITAFDYLRKAIRNSCFRIYKCSDLFTDTGGYLHHKESERDSLHIARSINLNFAFTDQFGFYINNRFSSPVVQKKLNPYLFFSYSPRRDSCLANLSFELGYGHESNGQFIQDSATFYSVVNDALHDDETVNNKYLQGDTLKAIQQTTNFNSRGWDYFRVRARYNFFRKQFSIQGDLSYRFYPKVGALEGPQENYRAFERSWYGSNLMRDQVSGLYLSASFIRNSTESKCFSFNKLKIFWETGSKQIFIHNSIVTSVGGNFLCLPLLFSYSYGYNTDLANFGIPIQSIGISIQINSFDFPYDRESGRRKKKL